MPSQLHPHQQPSSVEPIAAETTRSLHPSLLSPPAQKAKKMSLTQTYYIAASARSKLGREAQKSDHSLRHLVGHANLLDALMLELHEAEREQESWFNQTIQKAEDPLHVRWADVPTRPTAADEAEDLDDDTDTDTDSDFDEADFDLPVPRRIRQAPVYVSSREVEDDEADSADDDDDDEFEDDEDDEEHALVRTASWSSPPELLLDDPDSDSDTASPPTSPPQPLLGFDAEEDRRRRAGYFDDADRKRPRVSVSATLSPDEQAAFVEEGFFIPDRSHPLVAAC